jgi:hypothetical protein
VHVRGRHRQGKAQIPFAEVELEAARDYACEDTDIALQLAERFGPELERLHLAPSSATSRCR